MIEIDDQLIEAAAELLNDALASKTDRKRILEVASQKIEELKADPLRAELFFHRLLEDAMPRVIERCKSLPASWKEIAPIDLSGGV